MPTNHDETLLERYQREARIDEEIAARFALVHCSQCGQSFGPGDSGFSHCDDHDKTKEKRND
jgi:hypothetical protein